MLSRSAEQTYSGSYAVTMPGEKRAAAEEAQFPTVAARLTALIAGLSEAQHLADSKELDGRVRVELRNALDHIRHTASAAQRCSEARADAYTMLPILASQRVLRAAQLARDLSLDLENMDVTMETRGLQDLYQAVGQLHRQLGVLCKPAQ
jgi:hypothetical protein